MANCSRYNPYNENSVFVYTTDYEGIPQNLMINVFCYVVIMIIFLLLRKKVWDYSKRERYVRSKNSPFIAYSGDFTGRIIDESNLDSERIDESTIWQRIYNFIPLFIKMSDENLFKYHGPDCLVYCKFQRSIIMVVAVMTAASMIIVLPLNLTGNIHGSDPSKFVTLTIGNMDPESKKLWGHLTVSFFLMMFGFYISTRIIQELSKFDKEEISPSLMIKNVPVEYCDELTIESHFKEAYPSANVTKTQVTYRYDRVIFLYNDKHAAEESLRFCYQTLEETGQRVTIVPTICGRLICECCQTNRCKPVDGIEFYNEEIKRLTEALVSEKMKAITTEKLPIIFVTFENLDQALMIRKDYTLQNYCCFNQKPTGKSSMSVALKSDYWKVVFAPQPNEISWSNLHIQGWKWWIPAIVLNIIIVVVVILLSTPVVVIAGISKLNVTSYLQMYKMPSYITQFANSIILLSIVSILPSLVYWSSSYSRHWTRTSENLSIMNKLFAFIVFTVLILPSLGLASTWEFVNFILYLLQYQTIPVKMACLFMPDSGALFCNYIISAAFIGTSFQFLRIGEIIIYFLKLAFSRSPAENKGIISSVLWEFQFGLNYAWTMALFAVVSAYAVIVPVITPFGLVYFIMKHLVDRYDMIYIKAYSVVHASVHMNAAHLMQVGLILTQFTVVAFVLLRGTEVKSPLIICCFLSFLTGLLIFILRVIFRWTISLSVVKYNILPKLVETSDAAATRIEEGIINSDEANSSDFVPQAFESTNQASQTYNEQRRSTYGTVDNSVENI